MGDNSHTARGRASPQPSGSGEADLGHEYSAEEIRRFRARLRSEVEQLEQETRTKSPQELARERLAGRPRRTESEMRGLLEAELSRYPTLQHGWNGYSAKPASLDSLRDAREFLARRPADVPLPYPHLDTEGEVEFCWDIPDLSVAAMFEGDGKFYFIVCRYSGGKTIGGDRGENFPVDSEWPEALVAPLREL